MPNHKTGVVYVTWGMNSHSEELERSIASVKALGLPIHVLNYPSLPAGVLWHKTRMYADSPFDTTLFLDTDTEVLGDLSYGFRQAEKHGMAITIDHACKAKRWYQHDHIPHDDIVEYNTGVIFFTKNEQNARLFQEWESLVKTRGNDQPTFALAADCVNLNPFVLPDHIWNYRVYSADRMFGAVKIWHTKHPHVLTPSIRKALSDDHNYRWYEVPEIKRQNPSDWEHNIIRV